MSWLPKPVNQRLHVQSHLCLLRPPLQHHKTQLLWVPQAEFLCIMRILSAGIRILIFDSHVQFLTMSSPGNFGGMSSGAGIKRKDVESIAYKIIISLMCHPRIGPSLGKPYLHHEGWRTNSLFSWNQQSAPIYSLTRSPKRPMGTSYKQNLCLRVPAVELGTFSGLGCKIIQIHNLQSHSLF